MLILILNILFLHSYTLSYVEQQNQYLKVLEATSQECISGVQGGGRDIDYKFSVRIKEGEEVLFDSVWVEGRKLRLTQRKEPQKAEGILTLLASHYTGGPRDIPSRTEKKEPPQPEPQQGHP